MAGTLVQTEREAEDLQGTQELHRHVLEVAASSHFARAETQRKLLLYLWENRSRTVSEYAVGTEALGRRADFDPKTDASVRVQISRLRRKLKDFYEQEGACEPLQLQIPVGTHALTVVLSAVAPSAPLLADPVYPPATAEAPARRVSGLTLALAACLVVLTAVSGWLLWQRHTAAAVSQRAAGPAATDFWRSFVTPGVPVKIILPTPTFFTFPNLPLVHLRDTGVNDFDHWADSETIRLNTLKGGGPTLDHSYTVTTDTLAAIRLGRYLDRVGLGNDVSFEVTGDRSMDLLEGSSVVVFGTHSTLHPFRDYLQSMSFRLTFGEGAVENTQPMPGEQARYSVSTPAKDVTIEPALVAVLPGRSPGKKLLILQARHTSSLVELLTSRVGNELVQRMYRDHGSPEFFEMVVESEVAGDHATRCWPVALHPYTKPAPLGAM